MKASLIGPMVIGATGNSLDGVASVGKIRKFSGRPTAIIGLTHFRRNTVEHGSP